MKRREEKWVLSFWARSLWTSRAIPRTFTFPAGATPAGWSSSPDGVSRNIVEDIANVELQPTFIGLVDDTGAGDAFFAGVTIGLTYGKTMAEACEIGTRLAASVICTSENVCPRFLPSEFGIDPSGLEREQLSLEL